MVYIESSRPAGATKKTLTLKKKKERKKKRKEFQGEKSSVKNDYSDSKPLKEGWKQGMRAYL